MKSHLFRSSKPGSKGRRLKRNLSDKHLMLAQIAAMNPEHQEKFLSRSQRARYAMLKNRDA